MLMSALNKVESDYMSDCVLKAMISGFQPEGRSSILCSRISVLESSGGNC